MLLDVHAISKTYGHVVANDNVSFAVDRGEVLGLVGENGAGKSTILGILGGFIAPDSGSIRLDGAEVRFSSAREAREAGIGLVHQHRTLIPTFTVAEQLRLAGWDGASWPEILGESIPRDAVVEALAPGEQQRVEIARELLSAPRLLLLDEPTSVLAPSEVASLLEAISRIRERGTAVVIVSHKLHEIMAIADRIVVLARGRVAGTFSPGAVGWDDRDARRVLTAMFPGMADAGDVPAPIRAGGQSAPAGSPVLTARGLRTASPASGPPLREIDLDLAGGVVQLVVGVDGQGQDLLANVLAGYTRAEGSITLDGESIGGYTAVQRAERGVSLMPGDRIAEATIPAFSIAENLALKRPRVAGVAGRLRMKRQGVEEMARTAIATWDVRPADPRAPMATLSGGNMQRVIAARDIPRGSRVLIAVNPTQGLDVRTGNLLWKRLREHADTGAAVLVFVSDIDEAMANADRLAVMFNGSLSAMLPAREWASAEIAVRMVGP